MRQYTSTSDIINIAKMAPKPLDMTAYAGLPQSFISGYMQGQRAQQNQQKIQSVTPNYMQKSSEQNIRMYKLNDEPEKKYFDASHRTGSQKWQQADSKTPFEETPDPLLDYIPVNQRESSDFLSVNDNGNAVLTSTPISATHALPNGSLPENNTPYFENQAFDGVNFMQTVMSPDINMTADQRRAKLLRDSCYLSLNY